MTKEEREVLDVLTETVYIIVIRPATYGLPIRRLAGRFNKPDAKRRIIALRAKNPNTNYYIAHYKDPTYSLLTDIQAGLLAGFGVLP